MKQMKRYILVLLSPYLLLVTSFALVKYVQGPLGWLLILLVYDIIALVLELKILKKTPPEVKDDLYKDVRTMKLAQIPAYIGIFVLYIILILRTVYMSGVSMLLLPMIFLFFFGFLGVMMIPLVYIFAGAVFLPVIALVILEAFCLVLSAIPEIASFRSLYRHGRMEKVPYIVLSILQFIYCLDVAAALLAPHFVKD
jgi:hypothetical protein